MVATTAGLAACSNKLDSTPTTATTVPCATGTAPPASETVPRTVVPFDGTGDHDVGLPGALTLPLIVHAQHVGTSSFVVRGVDAAGHDTHVLASALGAYDGTFAVGFTDSCNSPTVALHVETNDRWHLDVADARNARQYTGGIAGKGDSVLVYVGKAHATAVSYSGDTEFAVTTYGESGPDVLVQKSKPYLGTVTLPAGPGFIVVTATGAWTLRPT